MRWPVAKPPKEPEGGDVRALRRFALWPVVIDEQWVWLERYEKVQEWDLQKKWRDVGEWGSERIFTPGWKTVGRRLLLPQAKALLPAISAAEERTSDG